MQNAINYAVNRVLQTIPRVILEDAFGEASLIRKWGERRFDRSIPVSIESRIISEVIDGRVREDASLTGAKQIDILLSQANIRQFTSWTWVIDIPDEATHGARVTQFLGIYIMPQDYLSNTNFPWMGQNTINHGAQGLVATYGAIPSISSENGHLIARNTIEVRDMNVVRVGGMIRVNVDSDESMSHLKPGTYARWADLVLEATKAYIYRVLVINMGRAELQAGYNLGVYKDVVDNYADAEENYQDLLRTTWRRVNQLNDPQRRRHAHRLLISRR